MQVAISECLVIRRGPRGASAAEGGGRDEGTVCAEKYAGTLSGLKSRGAPAISIILCLYVNKR